MSKINLDNAQKIDITAKRRDDFVLNVNIYDSNGDDVVFSTSETYPFGDVLVFSITDNEYNPILIASNKTLNINSFNPEVTGWVTFHATDAQAVAKNLAIYAGGNTGIETSYYGTAPGASDALIKSSIFYNDHTTDLNNYAAVGNITTMVNPLQIVIQNNYFDIPPGNYKYTFRSLSNLRNGNEFRDATTWLYGKIKVHE